MEYNIDIRPRTALLSTLWYLLALAFLGSLFDPALAQAAFF
jgi:hypothetical protein